MVRNTEALSAQSSKIDLGSLFGSYLSETYPLSNFKIRLFSADEHNRHGKAFNIGDTLNVTFILIQISMLIYRFFYTFIICLRTFFVDVNLKIPSLLECSRYPLDFSHDELTAASLITCLVD